MRFTLVPVVFALSLSIVTAAPMNAGPSTELKPPVIEFSKEVPQRERHIIAAHIEEYHKQMAKSEDPSFKSYESHWPGVKAHVEKGFGHHTRCGWPIAVVHFDLGDCGRIHYHIPKPPKVHPVSDSD